MPIPSSPTFSRNAVVAGRAAGLHFHMDSVQARPGQRRAPRDAVAAAVEFVDADDRDLALLEMPTERSVHQYGAMMSAS
jgi:hypothetical protein